jgi:autotransporter adhesin
MKQNILILGVGMLLGVAALYVLTGRAKLSGDLAPTDLAASTQEDTVSGPGRDSLSRRAAPPRLEETALRPAMIEATRPPLSAWDRLAQKYGVEKTTLSSKITSNLTSVITEGMELANSAARNSGSASLAEAASKEMLRNASGQLGLTEEQQQQAAAVIQSAVNKRMTAIEDLTQAMSSEPEQIMEMLLAGDALARNQITQAEYDQITFQTRNMLEQMTGYITGRPVQSAGSQLLLDPETTAQLNAILTPDQQVKLAEMTAAFAREMQTRQTSGNRARMPFQPGQIPVMEIERLDQTVASVKQMAEAGRLMLEAMKTMKEANPGGSGP